jgi:hypothetical protein
MVIWFTGNEEQADDNPDSSANIHHLKREDSYFPFQQRQGSSWPYGWIILICLLLLPWLSKRKTYKVRKDYLRRS